MEVGLAILHPLPAPRLEGAGGALGFRARWQGLAGCGGGDLGICCLGNHVMYTQTGKGTLTALSWEQAELPPVLSLASGEAPLLSRVDRKALDP